MIARIIAWWKRWHWNSARRDVGSYESGMFYGWRMLPPSEVRYNGGQRCDMRVGPCSCGAWHG
jgi:hypothetical protein